MNEFLHVCGSNAVLTSCSGGGEGRYSGSVAVLRGQDTGTFWWHWRENCCVGGGLWIWKRRWAPGVAGGTEGEPRATAFHGKPPLQPEVLDPAGPHQRLGEGEARLLITALLAPLFSVQVAHQRLKQQYSSLHCEMLIQTSHLLLWWLFACESWCSTSSYSLYGREWATGQRFCSVP